MFVNDKEFEIKYTINTLCAMATNGIDVMNLDKVTMNIVTVRELLMYGLRHENKKITQNQTGDLMDAYFKEGGKFNELAEEIMFALAKSLGNSEEKDNAEEQEEGK